MLIGVSRGVFVNMSVVRKQSKAER